MRRRWGIGAATGLVMAAAFGALAWMSIQLRHFEEAEAGVRLEAARQQAANLALWRMDLALARLVAEEGVRPIADYSRAEIPGHRNPQILLHFDIDPLGRPFSPEVAAGVIAPNQLADLVAQVRRSSLPSAIQAQAAARSQAVASTPPVGSQKDEQLRKVFAQQNLAVFSKPAGMVEKNEEALTPVWSGEALLLVRHGRMDGQDHLLGCWLDWPSVREGLLASIRDLLPAARLEPVKQPGAQLPHLLASLPVRLIPGELKDPPVASRSVHRGLVVAWVALGFAALALGALVAGVVGLSERKATFASAVTHELRTPLTTFRMYTEMLEGGMVAAADVESYVKTLRSEAERLTHLVENVLSWSRLERGRFGVPREAMDIRGVLEREIPRMSEWARRAGMVLEVVTEVDEGLLARGEPTAVGQILFNLVDNACKYARRAVDQRIELTARSDHEWVWLAVRDHGPGIEPPITRRLFKPFTKGAVEAALSAPGIGLGLPLSRRLARAMGGELTLVRSGAGGTQFELKLPRV